MQELRLRGAKQQKKLSQQKLRKMALISHKNAKIGSFKRPMREELSKLGFSKNESALYLLLLKLGPVLPSSLARMSGIKRPTVYATLKRLEERNLIDSYQKGRVNYFAVDDPKKLLLQEKEKYEAAESFTQKIKELALQSEDRMDLSCYKGTEGYREMYEDILKTKPTVVNAWMHLDHFLQGIDPKREAMWTKERIEKKIFARLLVQDTSAAQQLKKSDKKSCRETRVLPAAADFQTTCILYDEKITLFASTKEALCLVIRNPALYQMFMALFELTWKLGGKAAQYTSRK